MHSFFAVLHPFSARKGPEERNVQLLLLVIIDFALIVPWKTNKNVPIFCEVM